MTRLTKPLLFASPEECEQAFYEALESADAEAVMDLWLDDDDVVCIHPNGPRLLGYAAVRASWTAVLANGPLHIRCGARKSLDTPTVAVHSVVEEVVVTQGQSRQVIGLLATNAYVKTPAGWKMVLHHSAPAGAETAAAAEPHAVLH